MVTIYTKEEIDAILATMNAEITALKAQVKPLNPEALSHLEWLINYIKTC